MFVMMLIQKDVTIELRMVGKQELASNGDQESLYNLVSEAAPIQDWEIGSCGGQIACRMVLKTCF
jgi:hypothetical protein